MPVNAKESYDSLIDHVAFEAMLKGVGAFDDPALLQKLKPYYGKDTAKAWYPIEVYQEFTEVVRLHYFPKLLPDEGDFALGSKTFYGYMKGTIIGRVALASIKVITIPRLVKMTAQLWNDQHSGLCTYEKLDEQKYLCHYREFKFAPYGVAGMSAEGLNYRGAKKVRTLVTPLAGASSQHFNFDIIYEWE